MLHSQKDHVTGRDKNSSSELKLLVLLKEFSKNTGFDIYTIHLSVSNDICTIWGKRLRRRLRPFSLNPDDVHELCIP